MTNTLNAARKNFNSALYWEQRYRHNGNSGAGSYNRLAEFKANVINDFILECGIQSVIEFGSGDGNQLSLLKMNSYIGVDVSQTIITRLQSKFVNDKSKSFMLTSGYNGEKAELALSLDVIYHLVEDNVFHIYMETLFNSATKNVIIYASNHDEVEGGSALHVRHRKFTRWVASHKKNWKCTGFLKNAFPYEEGISDPLDTSVSDFFFFEPAA
ncbi:hypothetical protein LJC48_04420 [Desulfovibrio sp. OttesenSCG-928-C06]|nr:hypothetical protein [Desulfovibrio sp. OttesenSCG-928-C06]